MRGRAVPPPAYRTQKVFFFLRPLRAAPALSGAFFPSGLAAHGVGENRKNVELEKIGTRDALFVLGAKVAGKPRQSQRRLRTADRRAAWWSPPTAGTDFGPNLGAAFR